MPHFWTWYNCLISVTSVLSVSIQTLLDWALPVQNSFMILTHFQGRGESKVTMEIRTVTFSRFGCELTALICTLLFLSV